MRDHRRRLIARSQELLKTSTFALCPRGGGPSSIRVVEAMAFGAIPVMVDDLTTPYDEDLSDFVVRWSTQSQPARLDLLERLLRDIANNPDELARRRAKMWEFARRHHPVWFDVRYIASVL